MALLTTMEPLRESRISLRYGRKGLKLELKSRCNDTEDSMVIDGVPVVQPPSKLDLNIIEEGEGELTMQWCTIDDDIIGNMPFLKKAMNLPRDVVEILRYIICYLLEKDTSGIHLAPEDEKLSITKVDECGRKSTFSYKSNPAEDMMTKSEYVAIKKFVGVHPKKKMAGKCLVAPFRIGFESVW